MNYEDIVNIIREKPYLIDEGSKRVSNRLRCSRETAIEAIREAREQTREELKEGLESTSNDIAEDPEVSGLEIKSIWQNSGGKWLKSYKKNPDKIGEEDLKNIIDRTLNTHKETFKNREEPDNEKGLFIWTSDKHIGASVDESIYDNPYDGKEFERRMNKIFARINKLKQEHGKFDTLMIADLGDPLDGMDGKTARREHDLEQNMSNEEQLEVHLEVHKKFYDSIVDIDPADNIVIYNVCNDNHSGSFGYAANLAITQYLTQKYDHLTVINQKKFLNYVSWGVHDFILTHGKDKEDRKSGLPLHLDARTENYIEEYRRNFDLNGYVHVVKGDLHRSTEDITTTIRYKNCSSIFGASKWIHNNFGKSIPACDYDIIHKNSKEVYSSRIQL